MVGAEAFVALGLLESLLADWNLAVTGFKIIVMLFIVQYVRNHFEGGIFPTILTAVLCYIFLFHYWYVFGPIMLVYLMVIFGFTSILMDIAITRPWAKEPHGGDSGPTSKDQLTRMRKYHG